MPGGKSLFRSAIDAELRVYKNQYIVLKIPTTVTLFFTAERTKVFGILSEAVVVEAMRAHDTYSAEALKPAEALCRDRPEAVIRPVGSSSRASTTLRVCELCKIGSRRGVSPRFDSER